MAIQKGSKLYNIDQVIKKQNARLSTWLKHSDFQSDLTDGISEVEQFTTLQNMYTVLLNRNPELKQFARYDQYGRVTSFSRSKKALEAFDKINIQHLRVIERQPTYGEVYEKQKKALEAELKRKGLTLQRKKGLTIKQQVERYIKESSEIQFALNAMGTIYALLNEGSFPAQEVLEILRGEEKGGKRKLSEDGYERITPEQWDIVREKLGIIKSDSRFKKELEKEKNKRKSDRK